VVGLDDVGSGPHPVLAVGARQFVHVDDDVPVGIGGAVAVQGGSAPQPPGVGGVAPEVVEVVAAAADVGDAGVGVEHLECLGAHALEVRIVETGDGGVVTRTNPRQGVLAVDVLQPQVRVLRHAAILVVAIV
jgi:hypothetical protein